MPHMRPSIYRCGVFESVYTREVFLVSPQFVDEGSVGRASISKRNFAGVYLSALDLPEFLELAMSGTGDDFNFYSELLERCEALSFSREDATYLAAARINLEVQRRDVHWLAAAQAARRGLTLLCTNACQFRRFPGLRCLTAHEFAPLVESESVANDDDILVTGARR